MAKVAIAVKDLPFDVGFVCGEESGNFSEELGVENAFFDVGGRPGAKVR